MKTSLYLIVLLFIADNTFAQIPNNGFESFTNMGAYDEPDSWGTLNALTDMAGIYTATKGTPGSPGASYLKLTSKTVGPAVVNGIAVSGVLDESTMTPVSGFAYTGQPISFTGKWQHMIYGSSQGGITVVLTKWNSTTSMRDTVAMANQTLSGMAMSWANFTIPFTYYSADAPDSCIIFMRASGSSPTANDYLWVDNLAFSGSVVGIENNELSVGTVSVYPNPSSEMLTVSFATTASQPVNLQLVDIAGKIVLTKNLGVIQGQRSESIAVDGLAAGTYILKLNGVANTQTQTIVIR
ncbi:MAG: T9SS type A sorting domain-containing protein [Bacteroidetes bacterium]|nr:T9SS type A sorting domain-containing protein [Bacteroidota bacterium]